MRNILIEKAKTILGFSNMVFAFFEIRKTGYITNIIYLFFYDNLEFVTGITNAGKRIEIIKNRRLVLPGTEEVNKPFLI